MKIIKTVKLNDEPVHIFDYLWYIYDNEVGGYALQLDLIVSEIVALKYRFDDEIQVTLNYNNGENQTFTMIVQGVTEVGNAEVPILELCMDIDNPHDFPGLKIVNWDTPIEEHTLSSDITIEEIRKVEMPNRNVEIQAILPIDLQEWVYENEESISDILKESLYDYQKKKASE